MKVSDLQKSLKPNHRPELINSQPPKRSAGELPLEMNDSEINFLRGFAAALGCLAKTYGSPHLASMILKDSGYTLKDLKDAGCDSYDLEGLKDE